ncbi:hypothetical protein TNCT_380651 [Trichonephila clavata]|uniref:Uncharacterized protein n=1 Tax=Trichonephila clavata TaxID=2740835 RepID=A0A8X6EXJ9_TRICU|nr:hypothetical protein TNCT_380651 [Trichonephila clavata]
MASISKLFSRREVNMVSDPEIGRSCRHAGGDAPEGGRKALAPGLRLLPEDRFRRWFPDVCFQDLRVDAEFYQVAHGVGSMKWVISSLHLIIWVPALIISFPGVSAGSKDFRIM